MLRTEGVPGPILGGFSSPHINCRWASGQPAHVFCFRCEVTFPQIPIHVPCVLPDCLNRAVGASSSRYYLSSWDVPFQRCSWYHNLQRSVLVDGEVGLCVMDLVVPVLHVCSPTHRGSNRS